MDAFELTEIDRSPDCREIRVEGEIDLSVAPQLDEAIERADGVPLVLLDLSACGFIDSTGIASIVHAHRRLQDEQRRLAAYGATDQVLRIFSISGLMDNGLVFESAEEAQASRAGDGQ